MKPAAIAVCVCMAAGVFAQTPATFEAASIKPHTAGQPAAGRVGFSGGAATSDPTLLRCNNCTLTILIREAWDLRPYQLAGFTDPLTFYDLSATVPPGITKQQEHAMLQSLLAERFHLAVHRESKETNVYDLVPVKSGPKLTVSAGAPADTAPGAVTFDQNGFANQPPPPPDGRIEVGRTGKARIRGVNETTAELASRLSYALNRPIMDRTGVTGSYDYALIFDRNVLMPAVKPDPDAEPPASIETLLQEELGLRLERRKGPIDVLVVDHFDKTPTAN